MKTIILAGGLGTRLSEETDDKPKPMVHVGGKPILWHIMSIYSLQGFNEFVIATGYKSHVIEEWVRGLTESWTVDCVFTGEDTQTGGRIRKCVEQYVDESFFLTYGDGVANVRLKNLLEFHRSRGKKATVTAVHPPARFGVLNIVDNLVSDFSEKDRESLGWINGGFFVIQREVALAINDTQEPFETGALPRLASMNELAAYKHSGFWQPMDTLREKRELDMLANQDIPPWFQFS